MAGLRVGNMAGCRWKGGDRMKTLNETVNDLLIRVIRLPKPIPNQEHFAWINEAVGLLHELKNATGVVLPDGVSLIDTKELAAIRQLLSRLPQTADRKTVYPGMELFLVGCEGGMRRYVVDDFRLSSPESTLGTAVLLWCYSTREIAEAGAEKWRNRIRKAVTE